MKKKILWARILAIVGTVLVWLPIIDMLVTGIVGSIVSKSIRMDYLMPAELFPVVGVGSVLLIIAALLARSQRKWIIWTFVAMIISLVGGQVLASVSGLASGRIEAEGVWWVLVLAMLGLYDLLVIIMGIGGIRLIKSAFSQQSSEPASAS